MITSWISTTAWVLQVFAAPVAFAAASEPSEDDSSTSASRSLDQAPSVYFSREFKHPVDVQDYFPLQIGARWSYLHTDKDVMGPQRTMITVRWMEDAEILGHHEMPEGKLILRKTTIRDIVCQAPEAARAQDVEWCRRRPSRFTQCHYLIQGNYVYRVTQYDMDVDRLEWLHDGFLGSTDSRSEKLPRFFFPLDKVEAWAERSSELQALEQARRFDRGLGPAPNPNNYFWHTMGRKDVAVPYGRIKGAMHLRYGTLGGPHEIWFKEGIGIIRETHQRQLDFLSQEMVLLDFALPESASTRSTPE